MGLKGTKGLKQGLKGGLNGQNGSKRDKTGQKGSKRGLNGSKGVYWNLKVSIWLVDEEEEKKKFETEENDGKGKKNTLDKEALCERLKMKNPKELNMNEIQRT